DKPRMVFYYICNEFVSGDDARLNGIVKNFYGSSGKMAAASEYMNETNLLFTRELVEFTKKENIKDATLTLTHKAKELLLGEDLKYYMRSAKGANIITPENIFHKELFYSDENEAQINRLRDILSEESFVQIQNRLAEKGMCKGVAVLLYGAPGTGKTESVLQIAKATGRKIMRVDISASKSCWFGESEKIIKRMFTDYRNLCKMCRNEDDHKMPILLFNEADGILSKRKDTSIGNVAQTENAIQNIILEEMENLDGIMIATTNLVDNLDSAFERRFLFKVKFDNPTVDAKKKIWKSKLDWLDDTALETFAKDYDFSGGQIDNIVRKVTMDEVITGIRANYEDIIKLCKNEKLGSQKTAIGF
ncbi:MAG: ATP-binding protein, partial [Spirochaetales bacterium]|nr:ATP-binding protein [Spirochaetales bacterium]